MRAGSTIGPIGTVEGDVDRLAVVFGDQLQHDSRVIAGLDPARDAVLMMEIEQESRHVPSHKARTALFLSAMRHYALALEGHGLRVRYIRLDEEGSTQTFDGEVERAVRALRPRSIVMARPGEHRVMAMARGWETRLGLPVEIAEDAHFLTSVEEFASMARTAGVRMEQFYRKQRRRLRVLMQEDGEPAGGAWNFDASNRKSFGRGGPEPRPRPPRRFEPDAVTREVFRVVESRLGDLPGTLEGFGWATTREDALAALGDFIEHRLERFGPYEDAMWAGEETLWHSTLSPLMNLKLLDPREIVLAAMRSYEEGRAPIESVEGFVRQIIGWREFIRGVYWREGEGYGDRNALDQHGALPDLYWTGETEMACVRECVGQVLRTAYGHHIQRLMVTGNLALLLGVHPRAISDWYLGMYADGVDWATLPNTLGMAMHADGGVVGTKPYIAGGRYISKMSNYCSGCRFDPTSRTGERACPFTVLYWDFLLRNGQRFADNPRMAMPVRQAGRIPAEERAEITVSARRIRAGLGVGAIEGSVG